MAEKVSAKFIEALRLYVALVSPTTHKPSADEMEDEVVRRGQLGEDYVGGLGFVRPIELISQEGLPNKPIRYESSNNLPIEPKEIKYGLINEPNEPSRRDLSLLLNLPPEKQL